MKQNKSVVYFKTSWYGNVYSVISKWNASTLVSTSEILNYSMLGHDKRIFV